MQTNGFQKAGIIAFLILFAALKWNALALPYFWDEAWSYIPAIATMAKGIPCLLPDCIDAELYRGHPLFFYFLTSGWMKFVAVSPFSMHVFALIISMLAVLSFYRLALLYLSPHWSLLGAALLILQETFFVQSSFVLPEVLLMLLTIESIRNYLLQQKGLFLLSASLLCLTKETGIVIVSIIILFHLFRSKSVKKDLWWVCLPWLPAIIFFGLQKIALGWFFYPLHIDLTNISRDIILTKFEIITKHLFLQQGRMAILIVTGLLIIWQNIIEHQRKYLFYIISILIAMLFMVVTGNFASTILYIVTLIATIWTTFHFSDSEKPLVRFSCVLVTVFLGFSVTNFLMIRYLLPVYPVLILLLLIILHKVVPVRPIYSVVLSFVLILIFGVSMIHNVNHKLWHDDASINYTNAVKVHQAAVGFCEENGWFEKKIFTHFLLHQDLTHTELGYLKGKSFSQVHYEGDINAKDEILLFSCIELDESKYEGVKISPDYQLIRRFEEGNAWCEIYAKE